MCYFQSPAVDFRSEVFKYEIMTEKQIGSSFVDSGHIFFLEGKRRNQPEISKFYPGQQIHSHNCSRTGIYRYIPEIFG